MFLGITQIHFSAKLYKTGYIYIFAPKLPVRGVSQMGPYFPIDISIEGDPSDYNNSNTESNISLRVN